MKNLGVLPISRQRGPKAAAFAAQEALYPGRSDSLHRGHARTADTAQCRLPSSCLAKGDVFFLVGLMGGPTLVVYVGGR